jgi:hypothetical protein
MFSGLFLSVRRIDTASHPLTTVRVPALRPSIPAGKAAASLATSGGSGSSTTSSCRQSKMWEHSSYLKARLAEAQQRLQVRAKCETLHNLGSC